MICDICGREGAVLRHVAETFGRDVDLLVIEKVPVISCASCGESYFTAETLRRVEQLKAERARVAIRRTVDVVEFV
ncbi:MAG: type II toxin-antitoxin system MqsA family antitoxin [Planctomycetes bacterium]|nr:type II toxin-antitoxin system MqsA family antitoxin [Planctomycetota bacterium]